MKKREKIMIGILLLILIVMVMVAVLAKREVKQNIGTNVDNLNSQEVENIVKNEEKRAVMVKGKIYYDTGRTNNETLRCGMMDGKIVSNVEETELPKEDNQSNFKGDYGYQYGQDNTIEVLIDNNWVIFETEDAHKR